MLAGRFERSDYGGKGGLRRDEKLSRGWDGRTKGELAQRLIENIVHMVCTYGHVNVSPRSELVLSLPFNS
jgi:hypothetical protein